LAENIVYHITFMAGNDYPEKVIATTI